jgi:hypothetical protein
MNPTNTDALERSAQRLSIFLKGSSRILEFSTLTLMGTGIGATLCDFFVERLGQQRFDAWSERLAALPPDGPDKAQRVQALLADAADGPPTRNLMVAWYTGTWNALGPTDKTQVISSRAYQEALVWPLIGAHPGGAKQQGWDAWSRPPAPSPLR